MSPKGSHWTGPEKYRSTVFSLALQSALTDHLDPLYDFENMLKIEL